MGRRKYFISKQTRRTSDFPPELLLICENGSAGWRCIRMVIIERRDGCDGSSRHG